MNFSSDYMVIKRKYLYYYCKPTTTIINNNVSMDKVVCVL